MNTTFLYIKMLSFQFQLHDKDDMMIFVDFLNRKTFDLCRSLFKFHETLSHVYIHICLRKENITIYSIHQNQSEQTE